MRCAHLSDGLTLIESLVVLAVLAVALTPVMLFGLSRPSAASVARDLTRVATLTRWTAVQEGTPRTLFVTQAGRGLVVASGPYTCDPEAASDVWSAPPRSLVGWPRMGLAFAPDGRPRRCDGSAVGNTTVLVEGPRGDEAAVIVASLGRVRWERR